MDLNPILETSDFKKFADFFAINFMKYFQLRTQKTSVLEDKFQRRKHSISSKDCKILLVCMKSKL